MIATEPEVINRSAFNRTPDDVRIALVSDPHCGPADPDDPDSHTRNNECTIARNFERTIAAVNASGADAVIISGDLVDHATKASFACYRATAAGFQSPVYAVPGNHDIGGKVFPGERNTVTARKIDLYEREIGRSYWQADLAGLRLVGVNASLFGSGLAAEVEQWRFIDGALAPRNSAPALLVSHYPPFVEYSDEPADRFWNIQPEQRARLLDLVAGTRVTAVLSGHMHRPVLREHRGTALITAPPVSFGLPVETEMEGWILLVVRDGRIADIQVRET